MQQHMQGTLTAADSHGYFSHRFEVPEGATRLDIDFRYSPKRVGKYGNLLTLSVFDPLGERGTAHRQEPNQHITLRASEATPGYLPRALEPGTWNLMINCNLINPGARVEFQIDVAIGFDPQPVAQTWTRGVTRPRGAGWYRGDLHGHTLHSDGSWDVSGLWNFAREHQLDFVTLTDHNTISGLSEMDSLSSDELLTMGGFELTTFYGHALALGLRRAIDWRARPGGRTITDIKAEVEAGEGLFVIAHPACPGDPTCTGCHWEYQDLMPGTAKLVEICNEHFSSGSNNQGALELWYQWLNQGHRLYATAGSDIHGPADPTLEFVFNVVYAQEFAEADILDGLRHGHSYLSSEPRLEFTGRSSSGTALMGDTLVGDHPEFLARWTACHEGDRLRVIVDGQVREELPTGTEGQQAWTLDDGQPHWCLIEVRDDKGNLHALTNPIFAGSAH
jgi:hypothetical protein